MRTSRHLILATFSIALAFSAIGCDTKAGSGALIGGGAGAATGALVGSVSHARAGEGAAIGGAVGVVTGAIVGHAMDDDDLHASPQLGAQDDYDRRHPVNGGKWVQN